MRNLKALLEYDGTRYSGWQIQKNARTVGGAFAEALADVARESPPIYAAGRTDAGVHAVAQVVSFRLRSELTTRDLQEKLNDRLPADVNVLHVEPVPMTFHARHSATARTYRYQVSRRRTAFDKRFVWWVRAPIDVEVLRKSAELIARAKDFRSFAEADRDDDAEGADAPTTRCRIHEAAWTEEDHLLIFRIRADRFLWRMVRRLTGTMIAAATRKIDPGSIGKWLEHPSREPAALTAPPSGLFLESVEYPVEPERREPARGFRRPAGGSHPKRRLP
ncbi:MAG: tRNA pseudouridine(38-40) synthase TruA [Acidobacteria bacterium]|nr:tRNA pseudouridine(38-40) synthase TruA [Acidobacteriota bacterium]